MSLSFVFQASDAQSSAAPTIHPITGRTIAPIGRRMSATISLQAAREASGGRSARLDEGAQARVEERQRSGPWRMAAGMTYDDVIDPRELRNALIAGLELCAGRVAAGASEARSEA